MKVGHLNFPGATTQTPPGRRRGLSSALEFPGFVLFKDVGRLWLMVGRRIRFIPFVAPETCAERLLLFLTHFQGLDVYVCVCV